MTWTAVGGEGGVDDGLVLAGVFVAGAGATQTGRLPAFTGAVTSGGVCGGEAADFAGVVAGDGWVVEACGACAVLGAAAVLGVASEDVDGGGVVGVPVGGAVSDIVALPVGQTTGPGFHAGKGLGLV